MECEYMRWGGKECKRPGTHQIVLRPCGLADVLLYDPERPGARYCFSDAIRLGRKWNDQTQRRETRAHHRGDIHEREACVYCTPDEKRRMTIERG